MAKAFIHKKKLPLELSDYIAGLTQGNRVVLAQAITLLESTRPEHQAMAQALVQHCLQHRQLPSVRIGITGSPGVGKSTLIENLGLHIIAQGHKVAILAIDPSSQVTRGSILGDKTRMERLSANDQAFIRPSAAGDTLGGVARKTRETIIICEAAGYDHIIIETVGVGQSEVAVRSMTDCFMLLLLPGAGDELQGIKRGIVEMADLIVVNKADGDNLPRAQQAQRFYKNATHYLPPSPYHWQIPVLLNSAHDTEKIAQLYDTISRYLRHIQSHLDPHSQQSYFVRQRQQQLKYWWQESWQLALQTAFFRHPRVKAHWQSLEEAVLAGRLSPFAAATELVNYMS